MPRNPLLDDSAVSPFFTDQMHFDGSEIISDVTANVGAIILDQASGALTATTGDIGGVQISGGSLSGAGGASMDMSGSTTEITGGLSGPSGGSLGDMTLGSVTFDGLNDGATEVTDFETTLTGSATKLATASAIKTYVDANTGPTTYTITSGGAGPKKGGGTTAGNYVLSVVSVPTGESDGSGTFYEAATVVAVSA